jgi:multiple sugar transport system permease protein
MSTTLSGMATRPLAAPRRRRNYARRYWMFAVPAALVVAAVIIFPWFFTLFMSVHEWKVSGNVYYVGLTNYMHLLRDQRFLWAVARTLYFTTASVILPVVIGIWAAVCFARKFRLRGAARTLFILPMMATPVAIALVWTMMFHPQLGVVSWWPA